MRLTDGRIFMIPRIGVFDIRMQSWAVFLLKLYYFKTSGLVVNLSLSLFHFLGFSLLTALKFEYLTLLRFLLRKGMPKGTVQHAGMLLWDFD